MGVCASACVTARRTSGQGWDARRIAFNAEFDWRVLDARLREGTTGEGRDARVSIEKAMEFMMTTQGMTREEAEAVIERCGEAEEGAVKMRKFAKRALTSEKNFPFARSEVDEASMTDELSHYFVNSSHNTYLDGGQLFSRSTSSAIAWALERGCRVVELDCYDGGSKGPIITHGGTAVRPMLFKDAIAVINDRAHVASEYPVIVTLENHASRETRAVMAKIMRHTFGDKLWTPPSKGEGEGEEESYVLDRWPSPAELKGKVIIRDKVKHKQDEVKNASFGVGKVFEAISSRGKSKSTRKLLQESTKATLSTGKNKLSVANSVVNLSKSAPAGVPEDSDGTSEDDGGEDDEDIKALVSLRNLKFHGFKEAKDLGTKFSCSWSENKAKKLVEKSSQKDLLEFTKAHLLRTYPGGQRIMSNNYDPSDAWSIGASLVALNFQAQDRYMWVNQAKFAVNGGCGYVKKPDYLINPSVQRPTKPRILRIHVFCGLGWENFKDADFMSAPDTFMKISLFGCVADRLSATSRGNSMRTSVYSKARVGPRAQPIWNEHFDLEIREPELTVLQIQAMDKDGARDEFLAHYDVAVSALREGVRIVPLLARDDEYVHDSKSCAGVLCKFEWLDEKSSSNDALPARTNESKETTNISEDA
jgi:phosphatidylinositol phospholipase C delta